VAFIQGGQQANIFFGEPTGKALPPMVTACHVLRLAVVVNQLRDLLDGILNLQQVVNRNAVMGLIEGQLLKGEQACLNSLTTFSLGKSME